MSSGNKGDLLICDQRHLACDGFCTEAGHFHNTWNHKVCKCSHHKVLMLEESLETIWSIHPSLPFTEGKLRLRKGKGFGPGPTASVTETGLELGSPDFPDSFGPGHSLRRQQGRGTGEGEEKSGLGSWGPGDSQTRGMWGPAAC